jgi:hypothetical protein
VPNVVGFVLGAIQLIIYTIYKNKSKMLAKSTDVMKEEGPNDLKNRSLNKGTISMPKQQVDRQYSMPKIIKTLSFGPHELHSSWDSEDNVENWREGSPLIWNRIMLDSNKMFYVCDIFFLESDWLVNLEKYVTKLTLYHIFNQTLKDNGVQGFKPWFF